MKVKTVLQYDGTEREIAKLFKEKIFNPACKGFDKFCEICPYTEICEDLEKILNEIETNGALSQKEE